MKMSTILSKNVFIEGRLLKKGTKLIVEDVEDVVPVETIDEPKEEVGVQEPVADVVDAPVADDVAKDDEANAQVDEVVESKEEEPVQEPVADEPNKDDVLEARIKRIKAIRMLKKADEAQPVEDEPEADEVKEEADEDKELEEKKAALLKKIRALKMVKKEEEPIEEEDDDDDVITESLHF